jgi:hypothetical protein
MSYRYRERVYPKLERFDHLKCEHTAGSGELHRMVRSLFHHATMRATHEEPNQHTKSN